MAFLGWFGPRGLASIVFAVILLDDAELPHLRPLLIAIAVTIALSVYVHGISANPLTERYVRWWSVAPARRTAADGERPCRRAPRPGRLALIDAVRDDRAMTSIGPVQFIAVGFPEDATYEGRIVAQIERIEVSGVLRVLDVLFVRKDPATGELQTIDVQSEELQALSGARSLGVSRREVDGVGDELAPGQAAGMILVEHVWARDLAEAIESTGGGVLAQGLLGAAAMEEIVAELASTD